MPLIRIATHNAASTAGKPVITDNEIVRPWLTTALTAALNESESIGPPCRSMNQATTAIWPTNMAAKTTRPQNAVPQNFQTRGVRVAGTSGASAAGLWGSRESINGPSGGQGAVEQPANIFVCKVDSAVHGAVIPDKTRDGE